MIALLERIPQKQRSSGEALRMAARTVIRAGINFGLKASAATLPGASLLGIAAEPVDEILKGFFEAQEKGDSLFNKPDVDPVAAMAEQFRKLVTEVICGKDEPSNARLLVCIDDLDRCLPDRQVAFLEAIRFLTSSGAPCTFLVALDPTLAKEAVTTHYHVAGFDPDRYLDKMFHLRVNLPAVSTPMLRELLSRHLEREVSEKKTLGVFIKDSLGPKHEEFEGNISRVLCTPDLRNPRIVNRILDRLYLLAGTEVGQTMSRQINLSDEQERFLFVFWLALFERWPQIRSALQDAGPGVHDRLGQILTKYGKNEEIFLRVASVDHLPPCTKTPELCQFLRQVGGKNFLKEKVADSFQQVDKVLVEAGL